MESFQIINAFTKYITTSGNTLQQLQNGDIKSLLTNYGELYNEYKLLSEDEKKELFQKVLMKRPLLGMKLKQAFQAEEIAVQGDADNSKC